ncbi:MAG: translation initiation factor IF-3 [Candidatus Omnitrophica bacterium]|nr:translation initiation factor IF-3 [Candidatus Omnitrophota bacterium]MCF7877418.1 translation initiation factor IF-3 [Candidatus Omnitrophota bacterium]MCF7877931.1 translation initiation factor IF-3 [Candidatus Omnitrophota bacterium]MCF7892628.1 translation initiation factor IF-3 [Candidatus Omnitrophota bacterium]
MKKRVRVNLRVVAERLRLISPDGEQLGVVSRKEALDKAREHGLDLVEIAPSAKPPVCRIMDFTKYKYEQSKREKELKKHQKQSQLKEVRITPRTEKHDYQVKLKRIEGFLKKRHKVRIRMWYKGREITHKEIGRRIVDNIIKDTESIAQIDKEPVMRGKTMIFTLSPK